MLPNKYEYFITISLFNLLSDSVYETQLHHKHAVKSPIHFIDLDIATLDHAVKCSWLVFSQSVKPQVTLKYML